MVRRTEAVARRNGQGGRLLEAHKELLTAALAMQDQEAIYQLSRCGGALLYGWIILPWEPLC